MKVCHIIMIILIAITGCTGIDDLGNGYSLDNREGGLTSQILGPNNSVMVFPVVLECSFDSTFIIVSQRPWDSIPGIPVQKLKSMTPREHDKAFENSSFRQYWIINKKERSEFDVATRTYSNAYGPYEKKDYIQKREELGVPITLKLNFGE